MYLRRHISQRYQSHYAKAIEHHLASLKLADSLKEKSDVRVRRSASGTLVQACLGVADDIAWGNWQRKDVAVPKWIERGRLAAEDLIRTENEDPDVRLQVARCSLGICRNPRCDRRDRMVQERDGRCQAIARLDRRSVA